MIIYVLVFLGFVLVRWELWAFKTKRLHQGMYRDLPHYKTLNATSWVIGCLLALATVTVWWPYSPDVRILGIPLPAVVFERSGDEWLDFTSPLSMPLLMADFVIILLLPQLVFTAYLTSKIDPR